MKRIILLADINSSHTQKWARAIIAEGFIVKVISLNPAMNTAQSEDIPHTALDINRKISARGTGKSKLLYLTRIFQVRKEIHEFQPDIIHAHYASSYGLFALLSGFRPYYVSLWGSDILEFPFLNFFNRWVLGIVLKNAKTVFSTSLYMADTARKLYRVKPVVIPYGTNLEQFSPAGKTPKNDAPIVIGTVKSLEHIYAIDVLIRAFALALKNTADDLRLIIIGEGREEMKLKGLCRDLGIENHVTFTGRVAHHEVPGYLRGMDVFANLSRRESFGVSVLEASACALPVLVSDIPGLKEVFVDGETGLACAVNDPEHTSKQMLQLISNEQGRKEMGIRGRSFVNRSFDWKDNVRQMTFYYKAG